MGLKSGSTLHNSSVGSFSPFIFPNIDVVRFEEKNEIPRVGDIWIPKDYACPNCFIKFFIPRIKRLFQVGDIILKVDTRRGPSKLISWKLYSKLDQGIKWQLEGVDE
jgi:hypothetical protein